MKKNKSLNILASLFVTLPLLFFANGSQAENFLIKAFQGKNPISDKTKEKPAEKGKDVKEKDSSTDANSTDDKVDPTRFYSVAIVQALNKITAKTSILEMKIGDKVKFGKLTMIAHKCWQSSLDQRPESKILLEIIDNAPEENSENTSESKPKRIFYGWMFASSPSISSLEHPIYDITAINCKNKK